MASDPSPRLLTDAFAGFLTALRTTKPSPHTVVAYEGDLRAVSACMSDDPATLTVADLNIPMLQRGFAAYADGHAKATVARAWATWNRLCNHLVVDGSITGNPMAAIGKPKVPKPAPRAFTEDDINALLDTLIQGRIPARHPWPIRDYAIITTLAVTGLRRAELVALTIGDIEGPAGAKTIAVRHGKGDKDRAVPIDPRLEGLLTAYLADRWTRWPERGRNPDRPWKVPPSTLFWANDRGEPLNSGQLGRLVERAYRAAGINSHRPTGALVHALRHTFATRLIENGTTAVEVQQALGHASLATTQRYVATRPDHLRDALRANPAYGHIRMLGR